MNWSDESRTPIEPGTSPYRIVEIRREIREIRCQNPRNPVSGNPVSVHNSCPKRAKSGTIRCQYQVRKSGDNSVSVHHYCFHCEKSGVSSCRNPVSVPLRRNPVSVHNSCQKSGVGSRRNSVSVQIREKSGVSSSSCPKRAGQFGVRRDNSVSVHHYCFHCIKSVSWIHGKTSKTDRR